MRQPAHPPLPRAAAPFLSFGRLLRRYGFAVAPEQTQSFMAAVTLLGPRSMQDILEAALATLAPPPERRDAFLALFRSHFHGDPAALLVAANAEDDVRVKDDGDARERQAATLQERTGGALASAAEQLGVRDFAADGELAALLSIRRALATSLPVRRTFRSVGTRSRGQFDVRRSLRGIVQADGDVPRPLLRRRLSVPRKLLLLIDVSGSMKLQTTDYLTTAHAVVQSAAKAEVFTFGTRLTRITPSLRIRARGQALAHAADQVEDWDGGTRFGPTLLAFLAVPRFAAFACGAAIVILSDALERGDHAAMEMAIRRLSARAFRLSLCTPLAGDPRFRPETAALRAIVPMLDDLVDGSSIARLTDFILSLGRPAAAADAIWRSA